jgi:hypothetical protein
MPGKKLLLNKELLLSLKVKTRLKTGFQETLTCFCEEGPKTAGGFTADCATVGG